MLKVAFLQASSIVTSLADISQWKNHIQKYFLASTFYLLANFENILRHFDVTI